MIRNLIPLLIVTWTLLACIPFAAAEPPHPEVTRGYQAMKGNDFATAEQAFKNALAEDRSKEARFGLGTVYIKIRRYREALDILEGLVADYPDDYFIKNNVAWIYATATDPQIRNGRKSIEYAQEALLSQPGSYHVWSTLSEGYYVSAQYAKALRAAEQALRLSSEMKATQKNIHTYHEQMQKCARAKEALLLIE